MIIGVPKETKSQEHRVGMVPASVRELSNLGHKILVETNAGLGIGIDDAIYSEAGAEIIQKAEKLFSMAEMIVKVKELQPNECKMLHENQILFAFLHLAPDPKQTEALLKSKCIAIACETVTSDSGQLPLLTPMSEIAGRMAIPAGAQCLEKHNGGSGILLGGVPGVPSANVVVIGAGMVGTNAVCIAVGNQSKVSVLDTSLSRLRELDMIFGNQLNTLYATQESLERCIQQADLVIGAVLIPGATAPKLLTRKMLRTMRPGSVLVDVSIDQGGCFETSRPTTHNDPIFVEEGIVHYCVTNMPGAVPRTAAFALNNATLPYIIAIANKGYKQALLDDKHLLNGLNIHKGQLTNKAVAESLNLPFVELRNALNH